MVENLYLKKSHLLLIRYDLKCYNLQLYNKNTFKERTSVSERIIVRPEILNWAIKNSGLSIEELSSDYKKINSWIEGNSGPTINQAMALSRKLRIPFGYLLLEKIPFENISVVEFRTVDSKELDQPSRELIDTIKDMEIKQFWMQDYLVKEGYQENTLAGRRTFDREINLNDVVKDIREIISLETNWFNTLKDRNTTYKFLKKKVSAAGVLVMQSGIALHNTRRTLDLSEFRAFALFDKYAPLIFINNNDTVSGKKFSLMHELSHLYFGVSSFHNAEMEFQAVKPIEQLCNAIAAELLVPKVLFIEKWKQYEQVNFKDKITILSDYFKISPIVIARRALDFGYINHDIYVEVSRTSLENVKKSLGGGNAIQNYQSRLDHHFIRAISDGINNGRANYSDIYKLTGLKINTFEKVEKIISAGSEY